MITIEMPIWLAIVICVAHGLLLIHLLIGDLFVRFICKNYKLEPKEKEKKNEIICRKID